MKPRILIVDDDEVIIQQLFWTLSDEYEVVTANDLPSAVRRATVYEPAISILDLHLPPQTGNATVGLRILEYLKSHLPKTKVLVMSAEAPQKIREECYASGADEFMNKPVEIEHLIAAMRRLAPPSLDLA
jgi:CheY-like chemotaxis protein